jgi:hypothetical protein
MSSIINPTSIVPIKLTISQNSSFKLLGFSVFVSTALLEFILHPYIFDHNVDNTWAYHDYIYSIHPGPLYKCFHFVMSFTASTYNN